MMMAGISITGEEIFLSGDGGSEMLEGYVSGLDCVHVSLAGEARENGDEDAGAEYSCEHCRMALAADLVDGQVTDVAGGAYCDAAGAGGHKPVPVPVSWANSATVAVDESGDSISVSISVGDPRGAFVLSVERVRWTDEAGAARDELRLSVPHPDGSLLHMPLTPLASAGYYRIG